MKIKKKIGIIGGAGPMASCQLYKEIIEECQRRDCKEDSDFPEIVVLNYPFSAMLRVQDCRMNEQALIVELQYCFDYFAERTIDVVVIACNTLHVLVDKVDCKVSNFLNIVATTMQYALQQNMKRVLVLGSDTTIQLQLYRSEVIEYVVPEVSDQLIVNEAIKNILTGKIEEQDAYRLVDLAKKYYQAKPFDAIILACTELPLLKEYFNSLIHVELEQVKILDTLTLLASCVVQEKLCDMSMAE